MLDMKRIVFAVCCLAGTVSSELKAQTVPKVLTFEDAIKIALQNNVLLNQQKNNLTYSQMQRTQSIAGLGPTLSLNSGITEVNGNFFNQNEGKVVNGLFDQFSGSVNAYWNIFNGLGQVNRVKQYSNALEAQSFYVNRTSQDVINTVSTQYLTLLLDAELLRIAKENFEGLSKQLEQVKEQVSLGARSPVDEYNQDSQTKAAEIRALQAEINTINDKALLTQTLLLDPSDEFEIAKPKWDVNTIGANEADLQNLFETSLVNRGDYQRALKNEQAAKFATKANKGNFLPTLGAFGTMGSFYNHLHGDVNTVEFDKQFQTDNLRKTYGLQLSIPIFGGNQNFQYRTTYVQQKVLYMNSKITTKNVEVQVKTDVKRAYQNFKLYKRTYIVTVAQLDAATVAFQLETERYNLGVTNFVDFVNANRAFVQAQTDKASAEYRLVFQKILLDYAVGILKTEDIIQN